MDIQWYPGHMAKARKSLQEKLFLVDLVIEILDARIPFSSRNPDLQSTAKNKTHIIVLNKCDLANDAITKNWIKFFKNQNHLVVQTNSHKGNGIKEVMALIDKFAEEKISRLKKRGRVFAPTRVMIVGIPNVGKSTFINKFAGRTIAKTADRPGVTVSKQWIKVKNNVELMDTPGILWPKFNNHDVALNLAITGAINDKRFNIEELAINLIKKLMQIDSRLIAQRYKITLENDNPVEILNLIAKKRGFIKKGGNPDLERTAIIITDEFRGAKLGKISLESAQDFQSPNNSVSES